MNPASDSAKTSSASTSSPSTVTGLEPLTRHLAEHKVTRLALAFLEANEDLHLKDLPVEDMTDDRRVKIHGQTLWNFGSDSFLGLDRHPNVLAAIRDALPKWGSHNGASRAFSSVELTEEAEARLAKWLGVEDTFIFPSVTLANVGLLPALTGKGDLLVVDRLSHDSVHQGCKLAAAGGATLKELAPTTGATLARLLDDSAYNGCVVAVDGVYSMTGELAPLAELDDVARQRGAILYVDDAHGTGVVGPQGRGAAYQSLGTLNNVLMVGSLSKGFSCLGAFVTCTPELKVILKIRSSTFIFGGPVPPAYLAAICAVCDIMDSPEHDKLLTRLHGLIGRLRAHLDSLELVHYGGQSAIVSILIGDIEKTLEAGKWMFDRGFHVQSATYPAVPITGGLLRIQVNSNHPDEALDELLAALTDLHAQFKLPTRN